MMEPITELSVRELVARIRLLETENQQLRRALTAACCGNLLGPTTSCQLARDHQGLHAWADQTSDLVIRWA